jgi:hypothetical protein
MVHSADFLGKLFSRVLDSLRTYGPIIESLPEKGYAIDDAIPITSLYWGALKTSAKNMSRCRTLGLTQIHKIFVARPTVSNARHFVSLLVTASEFFDSIALVLGNLATLDHSFYVMCLVAAKYYNDSSAEEREKFMAAVDIYTSAFPLKSRELAVKAAVAGDSDLAFRLALAETSDEQIIACIQSEFR